MATVNNRYLTITRGAVVITGNTIGLDKRSNALLPGNNGSQGAHLSTTNLSVATGWSVQGALDSTVGIITNNTVSQIGSRAVLYIPPTATVLYAELVWFATLVGTLNPNANVTLIAPNAAGTNVSHTIAPDAVTSNTVAMPGYDVYVRSANVTDKVIVGTRTYAVTGIPGRLDATLNENVCGGWCLLVAYQDPNESFKNLSIYVLGVPVRNDAATTNAVSITIPNVITPSTTPISGRAVIAAGEGDIRYSGDFVKFGATLATQATLSGPNNGASNFFTGSINVGDYNGIIPVGTFDTRGSMGRNNHDALNTVLGARQGIDITNVNISSGLTPNQTSAILTFDTNTDNYIPVAFGTQIEVVPSISKTVSLRTAAIGTELTYTITATNPGTALPWRNVFFQDNIPAYTAFKAGSVTINNASFPTYNPQTGFIIATTLDKATVTVRFTVTVTAFPPAPNHVVENTARISYDLVTPNGTLRESLFSDPVYTTILLGNLSIDKATSTTQTVACGSVIVHTITIANSGNAASTILPGHLTDSIPLETSYIQASIIPNNLGIIYDSTNKIITNTLPITIQSNQSLSFSYQLSVNCQVGEKMHYCTKKITNTVRLIYEYTVNPELAPKQVTAKASVSNFILTPSDLNALPLFKNWKNDVCFSHGKKRKISCIHQHLQTHRYEVSFCKDYNILSISATTHTFIKYTVSPHRHQHKHPRYIEFKNPITINFIVPKYIHHNILKLTPHILEICPPKLTAHHISFNTVMQFDIEYKED